MLKKLVSEITVNRFVLRQFGWIMAVMFGLIIPFIIIWLNNWELVRPVLIVSLIGLLFLISGSLVPETLRYVYIGWMLFALVLGMIVTRLIITAVFYLLVTPIGFVRRHFGTKDLLGLKPDSQKASYWVVRDADQSSQQMKKQF